MDNFERIRKLKEYTVINSNDILMSDLYLKDENGKTYFEYIIEKNIPVHDQNIIKLISNHYILLRYTIENSYVLDRYYNINLLFKKDNDMALIELLFKNKSSSFLSMQLDIINRLFINNAGEYLIEKFLKQNPSVCYSIINRINNFKTLYDCFTKINRIDLMKYASIDCLLSLTPNGITMLQELINMNIDLRNFPFNESEKIAEILYKNKKYDALLRSSCELLVNYPTPSHNYLSILIQKYKSGENIPFKNIRFNSNDNNKSIAKVNIQLLKNKISYEKPSSFVLINKFGIDFESKPVIVYMLEMDKDLTIQNFIYGTNLEEELKEYIAELNEIPINLLQDFNINNIFKYLPQREKLLNKLKSSEKKKIKKKEIFFDDLLWKTEDKITLLEYALKNNIDINDFIYSCTQDIEAINILVNYKYDIPYGIKESLLYKDIQDNKKLIDLLIDKKYFSCIKNSSKKDLQIMNYCVKYNNFNILSDDIIEELFVEREGNFLAEKYLNNDNFISSIKDFNMDENKLLTLYKKGYKKILIDASEEVLLTEYNGTTILDDLLKENISPTFYNYNFGSLRTLEILYKNNRPDLMYNAKLELLMNYPNKNENYLQYIIECYRHGIDVHFERRTYISNDKEVTARCYIQMTKNNLLGYLDNLKEEDLLEKDDEGNSLLFYLINLDKELTLNKILTLNLKKRPSVFTELKLLGISDTPVDIKYDKFNYNDICIKLYNNTYQGNISSPVENLLDELRKLFENDHHSDKDLINMLIASYRYNTSINEIFIKELQALIEVKKNHPEFYYLKNSNGDYFSKHEGIVMQSSIISSLNHETGHALHCFLAHYEVPDNYKDVTSSISSSPNWLKKVEAYSNKFHEIFKKVTETSSDTVSKYIDEASQDSIAEISTLLSSNKQEMRKKYIEKGYSEETFDIIFSQSYTLEEFVRQKKNIKISEVSDIIMKYDYDAFVAIGDIIDAISMGKFSSGLLKNDRGEEIRAAYGHGVRYYSKEKYGFIEMIANYLAIIKSKQSDKMIATLKFLTSDELVNLLDEFYKNKIINFQSYEISKGKIL